MQSLHERLQFRVAPASVAASTGVMRDALGAACNLQQFAVQRLIPAPVEPGFLKC
jgi:hypothetical protein